MILKTGQFNSWTVLDDNTAVKHMDKSAFKNHGSGIPHDMFNFFLPDELEPGTRQDITLVCGSEEFNAYVSRETLLGRYRLFWFKELEHYINAIFDYDTVSEINEFPYMTFHRMGKDRFELFFSGTCNVVPKEETDYDREIDEQILDRLLHRKTQDEIEVIIGEMSFDDGIPVERKTVIAKRLCRNPVISNYVKERASFRCELCGAEGFMMPNGRKYAESHHLLELSKMDDEVRFEHPDLMICVCPTCHRVIHFGTDAEIDRRKHLKSEE